MSGGSPGSTSIHQTPGTRDPGAGWAEGFFNSLNNVANSPFPTFQGQLDPGLSPTLQNVMRMAQGYAASGAPEILGGVQGSLGRFMSPNFQNPMARVPYGFPSYFGNSYGRVFGGGQAGQLGQGFSPWGYGGGEMSPPWAPDGGGQDYMDQAGGQPGGTPDLSSVMPPPPPAPATPTPPPGQTTDPSLTKWFGGQGITPTYDASGMPIFSQRMTGASTAWNAGAGSNKGEMRRNPQTGQMEIYRATGQGGESFGWTPYDPNNSGHVMDAAMFQRYGNNWTSGGGAGGAGGHSTDVTAELRAQLGREPTMFEVQDAMYGVKPGGFSYSTEKPVTPTPGAAGTIGGAAGASTIPPGATPPATTPPAAAGPAAGNYGGYTREQLLANPALLARLGGHAANRWRTGGGALPTGWAPWKPPQRPRRPPQNMTGGGYVAPGTKPVTTPAPAGFK